MCVQDLGMGKECVCVFAVLYMLLLVCRTPLHLKFSFCGSFYSFPVRPSFLNAQRRRFWKRPATFKNPSPGLGVWLGSRMWPQRVGSLSETKLKRQTSPALCHLSDKEELGVSWLESLRQRPLASTEVRLGCEGGLRDSETRSLQQEG